MSFGGGGRFCNSYLELMLLHQHKSLKSFEGLIVSSRFSASSALEKISLSRCNLGIEMAISSSRSLFNSVSLQSTSLSFSSSVAEFLSLSSDKEHCSSEKVTKNSS